VVKVLPLHESYICQFSVGSGQRLFAVDIIDQELYFPNNGLRVAELNSFLKGRLLLLSLCFAS
jgi:hypothetical protein